MSRIPFSPVWKGPRAHHGLGFGPAHKECHADSRKKSQDMNHTFVTDAQPVFKARAVQPLMQATLHPPIIAIHIQKLFARQLAGRTAGDQVFDLQFGLHSTLTVQTADLCGSSQSQLDRFNGSGRQSPSFLSAAIVLQFDHLRGERSPAGVVGRFGAGRFGYP